MRHMLVDDREAFRRGGDDVGARQLPHDAKLAQLLRKWPSNGRFSTCSLSRARTLRGRRVDRASSRALTFLVRVVRPGSPFAPAEKIRGAPSKAIVCGQRAHPDGD